MAHKTRGYTYVITDHLSTDYSIILPEREAGFRVLLERWIVADTGIVFHQS